MYVLLLCSTCMFKALLLLQGFVLCFFLSAVDEHNAVRHTHSVKYVPLFFLLLRQTTDLKNLPISHVT
jgi:hypothetical protein